jgi:hypothetical protein
VISFDLPIRTVSLNGREHWAAKARRVKAERNVARLLTPATLKDSLPLMVRLVRIAPRPLDGHDNLAGSMKAVVDGIADKLGIKDNSPLVHWYYGQQRGKPKEYAVRVEAVPKAVAV